MNVVVRRADSDEMSAVATVLAHAFAEDPVTLGILGNPRRSQPMLHRLFRTMARHDHSGSHGAVDVAVRQDRIVGAAMWACPDHPGLTPGQVARMVVDLAPVLRWRIALMVRHERRMASMRPSTPHWYLFCVGAAEPGHGVGGALLDAGITRAGDDPCYLEASSAASARLYARKGFEVIGRLPSPGDIEPQYAMWRPGQRR